MTTSDRTRGEEYPSRTGLTLVEVVVVIAIVGILFGLTLAAIQRVRDAAARTKCISNLRQLALAVHLYANDNSRLPEGCAYPFLQTPRQVRQHVGISWHTSILPYVEKNELWRLAWEANRQKPSGSTPLHRSVKETGVAIFVCPTDGRLHDGDSVSGVRGLTSYPGVAGTGKSRRDGMFHRNFVVRFDDVTDGTANTLMIGERTPGPNGRFAGWYAAWGTSVCQLAQILAATDRDWDPSQSGGCPLPVEWYRPGLPDDDCDSNHFWSLHPGGAHFAMADGSVRFFRYGNSEVLSLLATRAGGEVVALPD